MSTVPTFTEEGFWWAQLQAVDPGTNYVVEDAASEPMEPVEVFENHHVEGSPERWRVAVLGMDKSQAPENFNWGPPIARAVAVSA
ncbi:hypothetical protein AN189_02965 [Loktanella sp. 3ANDIMAR09]|uniref:hypothetical protein n=1 Tax=Loktanella sp. 3ANDIMAR09 TaxID=1225657 RepID=UPI0006FC040D|nr:hypothetical protein [Loktanella sp. 3ANDIMAR09]KQI69398.1 hypothetical protein AN189_02965 [Loktanella sp. 3ANDIMAR09]